MSYRNHEKEWNGNLYSHFVSLCSLNIHGCFQILMNSLVYYHPIAIYPCCKRSNLQEISIPFRNENASLLSELTVQITFKVFLLDGRQDLFHVSIDTLMPSGKKGGYMSESNRKTRWRKKGNFLLRKKEHCTRSNKSREQRKRTDLSVVTSWMRALITTPKRHTLHTRAWKLPLEETKLLRQ